MQRSSVYSLLFLIVPVGIFFLPILISDQTFAYRDSGRFYYRQFEWNKSQWEAGRIPLWNPQENLGMAVVGEASSSVFYPLQVLLLIPWLKFSTAFVLYAAVHVYLASVGAFFLARALRCEPVSALMASISFSLCGSVLFQTCNIVFLVGASWLPFGILFALQLTRPSTTKPFGWKRLGSRSLLLGVSLAMPVLGGDPQTAYHIGIVAFLLIACCLFSGWRSSALWDECKRLFRPVIMLTLGVVFGIGLSAVQILPSLKASRESTRSYYQHPRNIYEASVGTVNSLQDGLFGHPVPGTHHDHIYQFSQPPWSVIELFWPNVTGKILPQHGRWSDYIPATGRNWTASVYCGLVPFLFFLSALFRRDKSPLQRWLRSAFWIFAIGSLGWFGCGWVLHEVANQLRQNDSAVFKIGAPVGGVYWFFVTVFPGYVSFRYPAKLAVVASLFLCLLAAKEMHLQRRLNRMDRFQKYLYGAMILTSVSFLGLWFGSVWINQNFSRFRFDPIYSGRSEFGPFDPTAAWQAVLFSLIHVALITTFVIALLNRQMKRSTTLCALLLVTVVDLSIANRCLLMTTDSSAWKTNEAITAAIEKRVANSDPSPDPIRIFRTSPMTWSASADWRASSSSDRLQQIVEWENLTLMPKHHLGGRFHFVESFRSIEPIDFALFMNFCKSLPGIDIGVDQSEGNQVQLAPNPIMLGMLSCRFVMIPKWGSPKIPSDQILEEFVSGEFRELEFLVFENPYYQPRFRIATNHFPDPGLRRLLDGQSILATKIRKNAVEFFGDPESVLSNNHAYFRYKLISEPIIKFSKEKRSQFPVRVLHDDPTFIELEVGGDSSSRRRTLVIADYFDEDWTAYRTNVYDRFEPVEIDRVNLILQGIEIDDKKTRVRLYYRPTLVIVGGLISVFAILLGIVVAIVLRSKRKSLTGTNGRNFIPDK